MSQLEARTADQGGGSAREPRAGLPCGDRVRRRRRPPIGRRLADLGFLPAHDAIHVSRRAPLGDPIAYELRGYRLCLRRVDALRVLVVPTDPAPPVAS